MARQSESALSSRPDGAPPLARSLRGVVKGEGGGDNPSPAIRTPRLGAASATYDLRSIQAESAQRFS